MYQVWHTISQPLLIFLFCIVAAVFCIVLAKIVDHCLSHLEVSDTASDISEYSKNVLKMQMQMFQRELSNKKKGKRSTQDLANDMALRWQSKVQRKKRRRQRAIKEKVSDVCEETLGYESASDDLPLGEDCKSFILSHSPLPLRTHPEDLPTPSRDVTESAMPFTADANQPSMEGVDSGFVSVTCDVVMQRISHPATCGDDVEEELKKEVPHAINNNHQTTLSATIFKPSKQKHILITEKLFDTEMKLGGRHNEQQKQLNKTIAEIANPLPHYKKTDGDSEFRVVIRDMEDAINLHKDTARSTKSDQIDQKKSTVSPDHKSSHNVPVSPASRKYITSPRKRPLTAGKSRPLTAGGRVTKNNLSSLRRSIPVTK